MTKYQELVKGQSVILFGPLAIPHKGSQDHALLASVNHHHSCVDIYYTVKPRSWLAKIIRQSIGKQPTKRMLDLSGGDIAKAIYPDLKAVVSTGKPHEWNMAALSSLSSGFIVDQINHGKWRNKHWPTSGYLAARHLLELGARTVRIAGMDCYGGDMARIKQHDLKKEAKAWLELLALNNNRLVLPENMLLNINTLLNKKS